MAAYNNLHRKIFEDETEICKFQCDPLKNPYFANCLPVCFSTCPDYCIPSESFPPSYPLPPPPPADGSFNIGGPPQHHHSSLSLPLKISLVVLVLTFSFFLLYTLYKFYTVWYRSRRRPRRGSNTGPGPASENQETHDEFLDHDVLDHPIWYIRTIGLQPSVISAITVVKYNKTDGVIEGTDCSVCLSEFQDDETLRLLPKCNHAFHISCIDTWLRSHTNCPLCRAGIVSIAATAAANSDDMGRRVEESETAISITEGEQTRQVDQDGNESTDLIIGVVNEENKGDNIVGGSGTIRRSVSLNDYAACRIRSDILNNNYYSDRHDVQIQSIDASLGFDLVKVDQTANNQAGLND